MTSSGSQLHILSLYSLALSNAEATLWWCSAALELRLSAFLLRLFHAGSSPVLTEVMKTEPGAIDDLRLQAAHLLPTSHVLPASDVARCPELNEPRATGNAIGTTAATLWLSSASLQQRLRAFLLEKCAESSEHFFNFFISLLVSCVLHVLLIFLSRL